MAHTLNFGFFRSPRREQALRRRRQCGHVRHIGWCLCCQRAQLTIWTEQSGHAEQDVNRN